MFVWCVGGAAPGCDDAHCQEVGLWACRGVEWDRALFPNLLGQGPREAEGTAAKFWYQVNTLGCSQEFRFVVCSLLAPPCRPGVDKPLPPCREVCESALRQCLPVMERNLLTWPKNTFTCPMLPFSHERPCLRYHQGQVVFPSTYASLCATHHHHHHDLYEYYDDDYDNGTDHSSERRLQGSDTTRDGEYYGDDYDYQEASGGWPNTPTTTTTTTTTQPTTTTSSSTTTTTTPPPASTPLTEAPKIVFASTLHPVSPLTSRTLSPRSEHEAGYLLGSGVVNG